MNLRCLLMAFCLFPAYMFAHYNIAGTYHVTGFDATVNENYSGTAVITELNSVYTVVWTYTDYPLITGTGVIKDDFLSIVFHTDTTEDYGTQLCEIKCGVLKGPWILLGETRISYEKLKKISNSI